MTGLSDSALMLVIVVMFIATLGLLFELYVMQCKIEELANENNQLRFEKERTL